MKKYVLVQLLLFHFIVFCEDLKFIGKWEPKFEIKSNVIKAFFDNQND